MMANRDQLAGVKTHSKANGSEDLPLNSSSHTGRLLAGLHNERQSLARIGGQLVNYDNSNRLVMLHERAQARNLLPWQYLDMLFAMEDYRR